MIPITAFNIELHATHEIDLGAIPGASLRGALYEALAVMYDTGEVPQSKHDTASNPVGWLLRLEETTTGGKDVPRPMAIRPPLGNKQSQLTFGLSFYGRGQMCIPMVFSAVMAMKTIGVGRSRTRNKVSGVHIVHFDALTRQSRPLGKELPAPIRGETYQNFANLLNHELVTIRFLTPTRIIQDERLCHKPIFRVWFQRLLERTRKISEAYAEPINIPFTELLALAEQVTIQEDKTRWQEGWSHSRLEGISRPMGGFMGEVTYRGDFKELYPYLLLGQSLQVGKNTIKGSGWYELDYRWR
jgi:hypothetical protein